MITVKEAAKIASDYLVELMPEASSILLEEVESDLNTWIITLSFYENRGVINMFEKTFKIFEIDKTNGNVNSMKIRLLK